MKKDAYTPQDIEYALATAKGAIESIAKTLKDNGSVFEAEATENVAFSFEQILRASLGLEH